MKFIKLTQNKKALIDDKDYKRVIKYKWHYHYSGYAARTDGILMHRFILKTPSNKFTDHINHNGLDNRRQNLRICSPQQNVMNMKKMRGLSKYKGVSYRTRLTNPWIAYISWKNKTLWIGGFPTEHLAALAYDLWAKHLYGKFASLNFKFI